MKTAGLVKGFKVLLGDFQSLMRREIDFHNAIPSVTTMFLTYRCNSRCKTCNMWRRPQEEEIKKEIGFDEWKIIIDKLAEAGVRTAEPFGGNALLRKKLLVSVLQYLHEKGMSVHMPTNQIGLDDQVAEAIVKHVNTVYLSTDGLGGVLDNVRGIDGAARLAEDSIDKLLRLRKSASGNSHRVRIVCNCTVSRFNADSIEEMVEYASQKGFDEIDFEYAGEFEKADVESSKIMGIIPDAQYIRQGDSILANREQARQIKNSIRAVKKRYRKAPIMIQTINIDCLALEDLYRGTIPHKKCYIERNEVTIDPYGNIVICPFITNYQIGSLLQAPFQEIWNNEKHRHFRAAQNNGRLPMCRTCILGVQRNPGILKSLQRIYLTRIEHLLS